MLIGASDTTGRLKLLPAAYEPEMNRRHERHQPLAYIFPTATARETV